MRGSLTKPAASESPKRSAGLLDRKTFREGFLARCRLSEYRTNQHQNIMTKHLLLLTCLLALASASAQSPIPTPTPPLNSRVEQIIAKASVAPDPVLTRFSLDFSGGTPKQLVAAIEKASGKPLNVIIPAEHADTKLPPLTMNNVDVQQLFQALELTSQKTEAYVTGYATGRPFGGGGPASSYQQMRTSYGFRTQGQISDEAIWYYYVEKPSLPPPPQPPSLKICRYYLLSPYLERGQTVDDITTAIQTGWKMLGDDETPGISFHKETKLLIAVGEPGKLETIDAVLKALQTPPPPRFLDPATSLPVSGPERNPAKL